MAATLRAHPAVETVLYGANETNQARAFINLKPGAERAPMDKVLEELRREMRRIPGVSVYFNPLQNLRIGARPSKSRFQYVMKSVDDRELQGAADALMASMRQDAFFRDVTSDAQM